MREALYLKRAQRSHRRILGGKCCEQMLLVWTETLRLFLEKQKRGKEQHGGACRLPGGQMDVILLNTSWDGGRWAQAFSQDATDISATILCAL